MLSKLWNLLPVRTLHGYENPELVETIFRKTVAFRPTEPWLEMKDTDTVLDFGGGCGVHYKQADNSARWAVVETPAMAARAKELESDRLRFFTDIDAAVAWLGTVEVMHSNGAVQYVPSPMRTVRKLCSIGAGRMLWSRLFLGDGSKVQISRLQDNGPGKVPTPTAKVAYPFTRMPREEFLAAHSGYHLDASGEDWFKFTR